MSVFSPARKECYCAFCKTKRKVYVKKRITLVNILASALVAGIIMLAVFHDWDPRFFIFFVIFLAISEVFIQVRWRISMICKQCGFDPVLYLKDVSKAADKVKVRLEARKQDPASLLAEPLKIPVVRKKGKLLHKSI